MLRTMPVGFVVMEMRGSPFTGLLRAVGLPGRTISQDLAITERSPETHLAERPRSR